MIDFNAYTNNIYQKDGIYFSIKESNISYPDGGNADCFQLEENSFWFNHRNQCIIEAVKKYITPESHFFDIGGGNGFVAKGLEKNGIETVLVEPGIQGCLNARTRKLSNILCSTLENASFKSNTVPNIGLFDVVEHIEKDIKFLKSIYSYVKKEGLVFITVPAYNTLWSNEDVDAGHFRRYTLSSIEDKLIKIGFTIEYSSYLFSVLPLPIFLFRTIPSKLGRNKNSGALVKHKKEHGTDNSIFVKILNRFFKVELGAIKNGIRIPTGSSCFVVARKH